MPLDPTAARFSTSDARWSSCSMLFARRKGLNHGWTAEGLNGGCKPRPNHGLALAIPQQHIHRSSRRPGAGRCVCATGADPGELLRVPRPVFGPFGHFGNMPGTNASGGPCNCCHHILFLFSQIFVYDGIWHNLISFDQFIIKHLANRIWIYIQCCWRVQVRCRRHHHRPISIMGAPLLWRSAFLSPWFGWSRPSI